MGIALRLPPAQRTIGYVIFAMTTVTGPIVGPVLGGWLTETWSWHLGFFINMPVGVLIVSLLLIVAGFPQAFIGILFSSALLVEIIFSLDGLGLLGFQSAIQRDYPVMFGTLYFFTLLGLVMNLVGDLMYVVVDPRIDFEARQS